MNGNDGTGLVNLDAIKKSNLNLMVRSELLQKLSNIHPNIVRKDMEKILEIVFSEIIEALRRGENIDIRGFGSYKVTTRKARIGRNPKTKEKAIKSAVTKKTVFLYKK